MDIAIILLLVFMIALTIRGFIKTKEKEQRYKLRISKMSEGELHHELHCLNAQVKHMPGVVRMNSSDGVLLRQNKIKSKVIKTELMNRGLL